ncbi:MAG: hypothetical protein COA74_04785 [Gammaproteobacteria bacterium]|nr:MAG: hypothetical protein COA74_04785 [Gammaproteobacteria bacterium]
MSAIWKSNLNKLLKFKAEFGHTSVPKSYTDKQLARLVTTLRQQKRYGILKAERELALHQIGFDFEPLQTLWLTNYRQVIEFYRHNGHSSPNRRSENEHERALADWVHRMHKMVRRNELSTEKCLKLKLINIDGNPSDHKITNLGLPLSFELMLGRLKNYIKNFSSVIHPHMADPNLYQWVMLQQSRIDGSVISTKEYAALINTGFEFAREATDAKETDNILKIVNTSR